MLSRIIEGDKSDNIIGIEGIGPKRAQTLAREYKNLDALLSALPLKGRSKYISNLNAGVDTLIKNEQLINLKRYNMQAILAGKEGEDPLSILTAMA
jgi:5'-3' exonuclease